MDSSRDGEDNYIPHLPNDMDDEPLEDGDSEPGDRYAPDDGEGNDMLAAESVEQYVRLHEHIERLRADRAPLRPDTLSADEAQAYQMAAFFRAAAPDAGEPDATFVANLRKRLMQDDIETPRPGQGAEAPLPERAEKPRVEQRPEVTRRGLLGIGLGAAAAFVGAAAGAAVQREIQGQGTTTTTPPEVKIVPDGRGIWVAVAAVSDLPVGAVRRFTTESLVGFVRHTAEGFSALSGVCTHMGCLLLWNADERTYDCPCHGGRFAEDGSSATSSRFAYRPLPSVATRVIDGLVWVYAAPPMIAPATGTEPPYSGDADASPDDATSLDAANKRSL